MLETLQELLSVELDSDNVNEAFTLNVQGLKGSIVLESDIKTPWPNQGYFLPPPGLTSLQVS